MTNILRLTCLILTAMLFSGLHAVWGQHQLTERRKNALHGNAIQLDPGFPYYKGRSYESIAEEIALAGYKTVHYFVTNENFINKALIQAFHDQNIAVWAMVLGNGTYSTSRFPEGWESWKMEMLNPETSSFTFLSPFSEGYVNWKKASLKQVITDNPFDGIEFAESYLPEWGGITTGHYGDVGPNAQAAFRKAYGTEMPDFRDSTAANYYKRQPELYKNWMDFRVNGVNNFLNELVNGKGGLREARPDILVATWSLCIDAGPNTISLLRERQALDVPAMVNLVKPDLHFIQTHWPDWVKSESQLPPDYMKAYQAAFAEIKQVQPHLPVGLQADIGSQKTMLKSTNWITRFQEACIQYGYSTNTSYEYHLGGYIYYDKPVVKKAVKKGKDSIMLSFSKRIDEASATDKAHYRFLKKGRLQQVNIKNISIDGNRVILALDQLPTGKLEIMLHGIQDAPAYWFFKGMPANTIEEGAKIRVN